MIWPMADADQFVLPEPLPTTGVGSMPGTSARESTSIVVGEFGIPHLVELPARGPGADMIGRTLSLVRSATGDFAGATTPSGWRLSGGRVGGDPGRAMRRATAWLGEDGDALEESLAGYAGPLKLQITGPWTMAAAVEGSNGRRLLGDPGACADLASALGQALIDHVVAVRRRVPRASLMVQVDEPMLPMVIRGQIRSASGLQTLRTPVRREVVDGLAVLARAAGSVAATPMAHVCASWVPYAELWQAGFLGVSMDMLAHTSSSDSGLGQWWDAGGFVALGAIPAIEPAVSAEADVATLARGLSRLWERIGFDFDSVGRRTMLTPTCGMAGAHPDWPKRAARVLRRAAAQAGEGRR